MRPEFAQELICPKCRQELQLVRGQERNGDIWTGRLSCDACESDYGISNGIPCLLPASTRESDAHWEQLHRHIDYADLAAQTQRRYALPEPVLLDYYAHAGLLRRCGFPARRVLELGAGSGSYSLALHRLAGVRSFCLLDISASALEGARALAGGFGLQADYLLGDIRCLPFRDRSFELSLSGGLIEHFAGEEQKTILAEHCRVAARVLIEAPVSTPAYWTFRTLYSLRPGGWPFGFEQPLTRKKITRLLAAQGFAPVAWGGHDFAAAAELLGQQRWPWFPRLHRWPGLAGATRHDLIVLAERQDIIPY